MADGKQQAERLWKFYWPSTVTWYNRVGIMAALIRHGLLKGGQNINITKDTFLMISRNTTYAKSAVKPSYKMKYRRPGKEPPKSLKFDSSGESIAAKGFHRAQKPYDPPEDVLERVKSLYNSIVDMKLDKKNSTFEEVKFKFLDACFEEFRHSIPNSLLSTMHNIDDVLKFYQTPIHKIAPIDALKKMKLPENLHIQTEYHRFHPDTDTIFGGKSAFPKSSTIVTGIRYKKKYKGYKAESPWL